MPHSSGFPWHLAHLVNTAYVSLYRIWAPFDPELLVFAFLAMSMYLVNWFIKSWVNLMFLINSPRDEQTEIRKVKWITEQWVAKSEHRTSYPLIISLLQADMELHPIPKEDTITLWANGRMAGSYLGHSHCARWHSKWANSGSPKTQETEPPGKQTCLEPGARVTHKTVICVPATLHLTTSPTPWSERCRLGSKRREFIRRLPFPCLFLASLSLVF